MRQTGYGLDITVPQWPMRERKSFRAQDIPQPKPHLKLEAKPTAVPEVPLPPSDGIEVIEEEYDYPEKDADAAEGWIDMRVSILIGCWQTLGYAICLFLPLHKVYWKIGNLFDAVHMNDASSTWCTAAFKNAVTGGCTAMTCAYLMGIILILFTVANMIMQEGRDA
eukprot:g18894.t1